MLLARLVPAVPLFSLDVIVCILCIARLDAPSFSVPHTTQKSYTLNPNASLSSHTCTRGWLPPPDEMVGETRRAIDCTSRKGLKPCDAHDSAEVCTPPACSLSFPSAALRLRSSILVRSELLHLSSPISIRPFL